MKNYYEQAPKLDAEQIIDCLREANARFVLIGGVAVVLNGVNRHTIDLDVAYSREAENLEAIANALKPLRPQLRTVDGPIPFLWDAKTLKAGVNFTLHTEAGWLDLLADPEGAPDFETLWNEAVEIEFYGRTVKVASIEHLIAMKKAAGRGKDLADLADLNALVQLKNEESSAAQGTASG
jgi:hypothetical protein